MEHIREGLINPAHEAGYFWGYVKGGWLTSHDVEGDDALR